MKTADRIRAYFARRRAIRDWEYAASRAAFLAQQIEANKKAHKSHRPLVGQLFEAKSAMIRAENIMRGS